MSINIGPHFHCKEVPGPKAYEVRSGTRYLTSIEDGEVRCWPEYHLILIDESKGYLSIEGGYGTFSYGWPNVVRGGRSLHSFLYSLDFYYFMEKASKQAHCIGDTEATVARLRREILTDRRQKWIEKDHARGLWDTLECASHDYASELVRELYHDREWSERLDYSDPTVMIDHPGMRRFWDEVWKPFCEDVLRPHWLDYVKTIPIPRNRAMVAA